MKGILAAALIAACSGDGTSLGSSGSYGYYWSSVPDSDSSYDSWSLYFNSGSRRTYYSSRYDGFSVRPVQGFAK